MTVSDQTHLRQKRSHENSRSTSRNSAQQSPPATYPNRETVAERRGSFFGRLRRYWPLFVMGIAMGAGLAVYFLGGSKRGSGQAPELSTRPIPPSYSPDRSMGYLRAIVDMGPRLTGSEAMSRQQAFLTEFFTNQEANVSLQKTKIRHPETGETVEMANLIAAWFPERPIRFLLCAHYDTRPFPDQDRHDPKGLFLGANDGASGVAAWMEMSHHFADLPEDIGVDVVLF